MKIKWLKRKIHTWDLPSDVLNQLEQVVQEYEDLEKMLIDSNREIMLYQSSIAKDIDLEKVKSNELLPVETKMITTLRDWANKIEDGELSVIKDHTIGCCDKPRFTMNVNFVLGGE